MNINLPLVSIIVPVYKNVHWLSETIDSILNQNYQNYEIIVVNDCSPEDVKSVLKKYTNNNIYYHEHLSNKGPATARNTGISNSNGEYILPLDSDDVIYGKDWLVDSINKIDESTIVTSKNYYCNELMVPTGEVWPNGNELWDNIIHKNVIMNSSMYPKSMWTKLGGYDENMPGTYEDWEFWIRAYKAGYKLTRLTGRYLHYRRHGSNISTVHPKHHRMLCEYIFNKHQDRKNIISDLYRSILNRDPDDSGLDYYLYSEFSIEQIQHQLLTSIEYKNKK